MQAKTPKKNIKSTLFSYGEKTYVMGILNVTPDSFSDGGDFTDTEKALDHAKEMIAEGAHMIDVGGESTRPGFTPVDGQEEIRRIKPVIERLTRETDVLVSIDTTKSEVAEAAIQAGAHIINDIWSFKMDPSMAQVAAKYDVPIILMHNKEDTNYRGDIIESMEAFFEEVIKKAFEAGVREENIILDPGIGFGKNFEQNKEVLARLDEVVAWGYPVLLGTSRKSTIGKILNVEPKERTGGTLATSVMGVMHGVDMVRVHDVRENVHACKVADAIVRRGGLKRG
ncbi:MAG TPA: dihydropteroate synthase [Eubacteriaceae bacterium]|nr:dihydropteroate synthase [Eubacteriaceae bacterium]